MRETAEQLKCFCSSSNRKMFWKISAELRVKEEFVLQDFHVWPLDQNRWASFWNLQTKQQQRNELKLFIISSFNRFQGGSVTRQDFSGIDGFLVYFWRERQTETSISALQHKTRIHNRTKVSFCWFAFGSFKYLHYRMDSYITLMIYK